MKNMGGKPSSVDLGGHSLFFWEFNATESNSIIFLHGLLDEGFSNRRIVRELLGEDRRILVFDLPGYGKSLLPQIKYLFQIDVWADLLLEAFSKIGLKEITLVGHSMGGLVSQHIVLKDRQRIVKKLVLLAPGGMPHPKRDEIRELLFPKSDENVVALLGQLYGEDAPEPSYLMRKTLVTVWNGWENSYLQENTLRRENEIFHGEKVRAIRIPTLIIAGDQDEITPPTMMIQMKKMIRKCELIWLKGAKHAIHLERPKEIVRALLSFSAKY